MSNKPSLFSASNHLAHLIEEIDSGVEITEQLIAEMNQTREDIALAIDRRKYVLAESEARIEAAKKMIKDARDYIKKVENVVNKIKASTLQSLRLNPDYNFSDSLGRKVSARKTPGKVKYNFEVSTTSVPSVVDPLLANDPVIAPYLAERTYYVIDTEKVKLDIRNGKNVPFAKIVQSEYVSGL